MDKHKKKMIATLVRENRNKLNYTQQDLADISNISLRSIQRIEKGEVVPRKFTLKALSKCLHFSLDQLHPMDQNNSGSTNNLTDNFKKTVLSFIAILLLVLVALAYVAQSSSFPETDFELLVYGALVLLIAWLLLVQLWSKGINIFRTNAPKK